MLIQSLNFCPAVAAVAVVAVAAAAAAAVGLRLATFVCICNQDLKPHEIYGKTVSTLERVNICSFQFA